MNLNLIRSLCEKRAGGMRQLASDIGMSEANLHRCVNNNKIQAADLEQIAIKLEVDIRQFFNKETQPPTKSTDTSIQISTPTIDTNKTQMLSRLINHYTAGNKAKFAEMIGIKPQLLSNWLKRNTFDAEQIYKGCKDISADWLLSGEGKMIRNSQTVKSQSSPSNYNQELITICKSLAENYQHRDDLIKKIKSIIKEIE